MGEREDEMGRRCQEMGMGIEMKGKGQGKREDKKGKKAARNGNGNEGDGTRQVREIIKCEEGSKELEWKWEVKGRTRRMRDENEEVEENGR